VLWSPRERTLSVPQWQRQRRRRWVGRMRTWRAMTARWLPEVEPKPPVVVGHILMATSAAFILLGGGQGGPSGATCPVVRQPS
jgi:hypothetical protein